MGFNSGLVILNDALNVIAENPLEFTEGVVRSILGAGLGLEENKKVDISVQGHINAASLFHVGHGDEHKVYVVGGNTAIAIPGGRTFIRSYQDPKETNLVLLMKMAHEAGYKLVSNRN